jgi:hypothetical protein
MSWRFAKGAAMGRAILVTAVILAAFLTAGDATAPTGADEEATTTPAVTKIRSGEFSTGFEREGEDGGYRVRRPGSSLHITPDEAVLTIAGPDGPSSIRMRVADGRPAAQIEAEGRCTAVVNDLTGNDPEKWRRGVPTYERVTCREVRPGIDLVFHAGEEPLEYDVVVAPDADVRDVVLEFPDSEKLELDAAGDLLLASAAGTIRQRRPYAYQEIGGVRRQVPSVGAFDRSRPLVIDPVIEFATYLGGSEYDGLQFVQVDDDGNIFVAGSSTSTDVAGAGTNSGMDDALIAKLDPTGAVLWITYIGGDHLDGVGKFRIDGNGDLHMVGRTDSFDFPIVNGFQPIHGDDPLVHPEGRDGDAFYMKLNGAGDTILYSTFIGGGFFDGNWMSIGIDGNDLPYVSGVVKWAELNVPSSTVIGTWASPAHIGYVLKLDPSQDGMDSVVYCTYVSVVYAYDIDVDSAGHAYFVGSTHSTNLPTTNGYQTAKSGSNDFYLVKLNLAGDAPLYATYLGGNGSEAVPFVEVDDDGIAVIAGAATTSERTARSRRSTRRSPARRRSSGPRTSRAATSTGSGGTSWPRTEASP